MAKGWYIIQTSSGYEGRVESKIRGMMESGELPADVVFDVKIPVAETTEIRNGKKKTIAHKFLPGYILVELDLSENGWRVVGAALRKINGCAGFLGSKNTMPHPISDDEALSVLQKMGGAKGERVARVGQSFSVGEQVKIVDGSFASFAGSVQEVIGGKGRLKVSVGIFGRETTVEVDCNQVEKI